jgi:diadenylate cyclase
LVKYYQISFGIVLIYLEGVLVDVGQILGAADQASYFWDSLRLSFTPFMVIDILIVALFVYWIYVFLKETRAMRIVYGFLFLAALAIIGRLFNLILLNWILKYLMTMLVVAIPVVFQPELRGVLERLGRARFISDLGSLSRYNLSKLVDELVSAAEVLAAQKIGALIVIQRKTGLKEYISNGIDLEARVSAELLLSIFFPKSPLHDGATIISGDKIVAAGCTLPINESPLEYMNLGTRHKSALSLSEQSDAVIIVVSEETGQISLAVDGQLSRRISIETLKTQLLKNFRSPGKEQVEQKA